MKGVFEYSLSSFCPKTLFEFCDDFMQFRWWEVNGTNPFTLYLIVLVVWRRCIGIEPI